MGLDTAQDGLGRVFVFGGEVFACLADSQRAKGVLLKRGAAVVKPEICPAEEVMTAFSGGEIRLSTTHIGSQSTSIPPEAFHGQIFACHVNQLADWTLSGQDTIQLMMVERDAAARIRIGAPMRLPPSERPQVLRGHLATHRAEASLILRIHEPQTGRDSRHEIRFDPACRGGQQVEGYLSFDIPLPPSAHPREAEIEVQYTRFVDDGTGTEPFLFIAGLRAEDAEATHRDARRPLVLKDAPAPPGTVWVKALLPTDPAPSLILEGEGLLAELDVFRVPRVEITEDHGHVLILNCSHDTPALLICDGAVIEPVQLSDRTVLRLPSEVLDGQVRHVELRDLSGSVRLLSSIRLLPWHITDPEVLKRESRPPFLTQAAPQTTSRDRSLRAWLDHQAATGVVMPADVITALNALENGITPSDMPPLAFEVVENPVVSIVIPAHNNVSVTYHALCSLRLAWTETPFEIIVVDDGSTDETLNLPEIVTGVTFVRNDTAQRFIRACNAGAAQARGAHILLLNNDVEVTHGWLDALVAGMNRDDRVGMVGSKLVYPDGRLQDAGGILWRSGNPWNYGNGQNPWDPRFCYARQVDYLSGAALMIRRPLWDALGGLSAEFEPMYFEDTDLAFRARAAGYETWFIPSSVVVHFEGGTAGTDVTTGLKQNQEVNRPKFKRKWARACAHFGLEGQDPDLEKDRGVVGRVLFLDAAAPRPDRDAGSYAALQEMRLVQSLGYKVSFADGGLTYLGDHTEEFQREGIEVIRAPFFASISDYLQRHGAALDAVYITRYYVARDVLEAVRLYAPQAKVLFNQADLHFLREFREAARKNDPDLLEEARETRKQETAVLRQVDVVLSYSDAEQAIVEVETEGQVAVRRCPWVVHVDSDAPTLQNRAGLSFLGGFNHSPNLDAVSWFKSQVLGGLDPACGDLHVYGSGVTDAVRALDGDRLRVEGFVETVEMAFAPHRIFVAPLRFGAGIKGKVLSAIAHGIPCVLSPLAAEATQLRSGQDCLIADSPAEWTEALNLLATDDALWQQMSDSGRTLARSVYGFDTGRKRMRHAFEAAGLYQSLP